MIKRTLKLLPLLLFLLLFFPSPSNAADANFWVEFSPKIPGPNETVSAKIMSYTFDTDRAYIKWSVNGYFKLKGLGKKNFSFKVGKRGEKTTVVVSAIAEDNSSERRVFHFNPSEVDLLWSAQTYTPFFYNGKALSGPGSMIKVTAVPYFGKYANTNPSGLIYKWKLNYKNKPEKSGVGKNSFVFISNKSFDENVVSVEVSDYKETTKAKNSVRIQNVQPELLFYEDSPLSGLFYGMALGNEFNINKNEILIKAEPYYFSLNAMRGIAYKWTMNNKIIQAEKGGSEIDFRTESGTSGTADIRLRISSPYNLLQFAGKALSVIFGRQ